MVHLIVSFFGTLWYFSCRVVEANWLFFLFWIRQRHSNYLLFVSLINVIARDTCVKLLPHRTFWSAYMVNFIVIEIARWACIYCNFFFFHTHTHAIVFIWKENALISACIRSTNPKLKRNTLWLEEKLKCSMEKKIVTLLVGL